jgi:seryl-tRNA synthetase
MLDIHRIREQPDLLREALRKRQMETSPVDQILAADEERRTALAELEALRNQRNVASKEIGRMGKAATPDGEAEREARKAQVREINVRIENLTAAVGEIETRLAEWLAQVPNYPDPDVPYGKDDSENVVARTVGEPRVFDFAPLAHWDLGPALGIIDFERGTKLAGARDH